MKLLCLGTGKEVEIGDRLLAVSGLVKGHTFGVVGIDEPDGICPDGRIHYLTRENTKVKDQRHFVPRVMDCIFIEDDSVVTSVTYDNEKSIGKTIEDVVTKLNADGREVKQILLGYREWDRIRDLASQDHSAPITGKIPQSKFLGVPITRIFQREVCLAFEHRPVTKEDENVEEQK